ISFASAYGPSVTVLCFPVTSLPVRSSGLPRSLIWPLSASCCIQVIHVCILFCICSGDPIAARLAASVLRNRNTNSLIKTPCYAARAADTNWGLLAVRRFRGTDADIVRWRGQGGAGEGRHDAAGMVDLATPQPTVGDTVRCTLQPQDSRRPARRCATAQRASGLPPSPGGA